MAESGCEMAEKAMENVLMAKIFSSYVFIILPFWIHLSLFKSLRKLREHTNETL